MNRLVLLKTPDADSEAGGGQELARPKAAAVIEADPAEGELFCDPLAGTYYYADPESHSCSCQRSYQPVTRLGRHRRPPVRG